jgi:hypothetical protein
LGGGEGVTGFSQLRDGTLFVVGKFQKKLAGEVHCGLQRDPADPSRVMLDALQFATNEYLSGSAETTLPTPEEVHASVQAVQGA